MSTIKGYTEAIDEKAKVAVCALDHLTNAVEESIDQEEWTAMSRQEMRAWLEDMALYRDQMENMPPVERHDTENGD